MAPRKVTVFGGTGFLGQRVVQRLLERDFSVRVAVRHPERIAALFPALHLDAIQADVNDDRSVAAAGCRGRRECGEPVRGEGATDLPFRSRRSRNTGRPACARSGPIPTHPSRPRKRRPRSAARRWRRPIRISWGTMRWGEALKPAAGAVAGGPLAGRRTKRTDKGLCEAIFGIASGRHSFCLVVNRLQGSISSECAPEL